MSSLIERIRKARQTRVMVEGKTFIVRRPTDWEVLDMTETGKNRQMDILEKFVEGWEGFTETDLVPGGGGVLVEFSKELFAEWVQDNPGVWAPITKAVLAEYNSHAEKLAEAEKK